MPTPMPKPFGRRHIANHTNASATSPETMSLKDCLEEAEICCEHARIAGRQHRFGAAHGLFKTATSLYRRAIATAGTAEPTLDSRLRGVEAEMSAYAELARSFSRPLQRSG